MPRPFKFRFETMLKIRRQREDQHKRIVGQRLRQIQQVREQIASLEHQIGEETRAIRAGQEGGSIDMLQLVRHRYWLGHLNRNLLDGVARLRFLEARLAQERAALAEAVKHRRILDKLKERQQSRYQLEENRRETRELDEMATTRYVFEELRLGAET